MSNILVVDDHKLILETLEKALSKEGYRVKTAQNGSECLESLKLYETDLVLLDMRLPDIDGINLLKTIKKNYPYLIVIIMTAYGSLDKAQEALNYGALDFIHKPIRTNAIVSILNLALEIHSLRSETQAKIQRNKEKYGYHNIIGKSEATQKIVELLTKIVRNDVPSLLIEGESGTGKDVIAKSIHYNGRRAFQHFVKINCASIPYTLLESELFGYEAGAFTGAKKQKKGLFELANGGTLFLDEVGEMPLDIQAKLLNVLEEKSFRRIGGLRDIKIDTRIIAATNKNLKQEVEKKTFREDLYYRLNVINMYLPPLKERKEDIIPLTKHFLNYYSKEFKKPVKQISDQASEWLMAYDWPGNVRELINTIERIMILEDCKIINPQNLPSEILNGGKTTYKNSTLSILDKLVNNSIQHIDFETMTKLTQSAFIKKALEITHGNKTQAAKILGMTRLSLHYQIKKLDITNDIVSNEEC